ncbi:hypothetical protein BH10PSE14_BH10PSE14_04680 [soil metagenome]
MTDAKQSLPDMYHEHLARCIDEKGIEIPHGFVVHQDGTMTLLALAVPPDHAYRVMLSQWLRDAKEMIFALDRFARDGQGTTLGDLMAGYYFVRGERPRPFIIEYQHEPRIVYPIAWDNAFWNSALARELKGATSNFTLPRSVA